MNYIVETLPCLSDNYAFLIIEEEQKKAILVDAPESGPIMDYLDTNGLKLDYILLTHHHSLTINHYSLMNSSMMMTS